MNQLQICNSKIRITGSSLIRQRLKGVCCESDEQLQIHDHLNLPEHCCRNMVLYKCMIVTNAMMARIMGHWRFRGWCRIKGRSRIRRHRRIMGCWRFRGLFRIKRRSRIRRHGRIMGHWRFRGWCRIKGRSRIRRHRRIMGRWRFRGGAGSRGAQGSWGAGGLGGSAGSWGAGGSGGGARSSSAEGSGDIGGS